MEAYEDKIWDDNEKEIGGGGWMDGWMREQNSCSVTGLSVRYKVCEE